MTNEKKGLFGFLAKTLKEGAQDAYSTVSETVKERQSATKTVADWEKATRTGSQGLQGRLAQIMFAGGQTVPVEAEVKVYGPYGMDLQFPVYDASTGEKRRVGTRGFIIDKNTGQVVSYQVHGL